MSLDDFNTNFNNNEEFEDEPTSVLQQIADTPFTVTKVKAGIAKSGNQYCIVWTEKAYEAGVNIAEDGEEDNYVKKQVKKWFVTVREPKLFFSDPKNMGLINDGRKCGPMTITKKSFTAEEIAQNAKLKGKSHYTVVLNPKQ